MIKPLVVLAFASLAPSPAALAQGSGLTYDCAPPGRITVFSPLAPTPGASLVTPGRAAATPRPAVSGGRNPARSPGRLGATLAAPARGGPLTGGAAAAGLDDGSWTLWWNYNREAYFDAIAWTRNSPDELAAITSTTPRTLALSSATIHDEIMPALLAALEAKPSAELKRAILLSLAKIGHRGGGQLGASHLQELISNHLTDANQQVAETACISLGILNRPASLTLLAGLLQDTQASQRLLKTQHVSHRMRAYAAYGIGLLGERTEMSDVRQFASHVLLGALREECGSTPDVHAAAVISLGLCGSGEKAIDALLALLASKREHDEVRAHVPAALAKLTQDTTPQTRQRVMAFLVKYAKRHAETSTVKQGCIAALGQALRCGPLDAANRKELIQLAKQGNIQERGWALLSLAQVATRSELDAPDPSAGASEIHELLLKGLTRSRSTIEPWVALSVGVLAHGLREQGLQVSASLGSALRDGLKGTNSPEMALAYGIGLGLVRDPLGLPLLEAKLSKFDVETRSMLTTALGLQGDADASEILFAGMHEARHSPGALASSAHSLALLNQPDVVEHLQSMFEDCSCLLSTAGITNALARTRHPDAVKPLLHQLGKGGTTETHRALAAVALGNLAENQQSPWSLRLSKGLNYRAHVSTLTEPGYGILRLP